MYFFSVHSGDEGSVTSTIEDGKLKIKTVSETPEIRNLSDQSIDRDQTNDQSNNHEAHNSGSESDDGSSESKISGTNDVVTTSENKQSKQLSNNCTQ